MTSDARILRPSIPGGTMHDDVSLVPGRTTPRYSLRDVAALAFYHWRTLAIGFAIPVVLAAVACLFDHRTYDVESRLLVLMGQDYVGEGDAASPTPGIVVDQPRAVQTEVEILSNARVVSEALKMVGVQSVFPALATEAERNETAALDSGTRQLVRQLRIDVPPNSNVIRIAYSHSDPLVAARVVNSVVETYLAQRRVVLAHSQSEFLAQETSAAKERLRLVENAINRTKRAARVIDIAASRSALLQREQDVGSASRAAQARISSIRSQVQALGDMLAHTPSDVVIEESRTRQGANDHQRTQLRSELQDLQDERDRLARVYPDGFPKLTDADNRIASMRQVLASYQNLSTEQTRRGRNGNYDQLALERDRLTAEEQGQLTSLKDLARQAADIGTQMAAMQTAELELTTLERQRKLEEQSYLEYARRTEEARVQEDNARTRAANVRVIAPAEPPSRGRSLRTSIAMAGVVSGLLVGIASVFLKATTREVFLIPTELERASHLSTLATFWSAAQSGKRRIRIGAREAATQAQVSSGAFGMSRLLHTVRRAGGGEGKVVHFACPDGSSAGVADAIEEFALAIAAEERKPVLLIASADRKLSHQTLISDDRAPEPDPIRSSDTSGLNPDLGISRVFGTNLYLLDVKAAIDAPSNPAGADYTMEALRSRFGVTVLDGTDFADNYRSVQMAAAADATVIVVSAAETPRFKLRDMLRQVRDIGGNPVGTILVNRRSYVPEPIYRMI